MCTDLRGHLRMWLSGHSPIVQYPVTEHPDSRIQSPVSLWQIPRQDTPGQTAYYFQIAVQWDTAQRKLPTPPQHQVTLITKTLLPSWYEGSETLTCGEPHNFPGMLKIPFVSPVKRVRCPFLKMDAPSQGPGFRGAPETWVAWQEGWLLCAVGHYRVQDESGTRGFLHPGLLPGQTGGRRDLEDPCDQSFLENTWYHNKDVWKLWLWARAQPTGNLQMQSYFRSQGMNEWIGSSMLQVRVSLQVGDFQSPGLLLFLALQLSSSCHCTHEHPTNKFFQGDRQVFFWWL